MKLNIMIEEGDELKFQAVPKWNEAPVTITMWYDEYNDELQIVVSEKNGKGIDHTTVMLSRVEQ